MDNKISRNQDKIRQRELVGLLVTESGDYCSRYQVYRRLKHLRSDCYRSYRHYVNLLVRLGRYEQIEALSGRGPNHDREIQSLLQKFKEIYENKKGIDLNI